ncbi:hypothetical protein BpKM390_42130 [Burkholderia pseudomallei]|nr:hypothetical protein TKS_40910 [Burkholderia pseudomallei]BEH62968.1 hypothetical protein BpKM390_42130 [Burkholderia pseudomallei]
MPVSWSVCEMPGGTFSATTVTAVPPSAASNSQRIVIAPANTGSGESNSNAWTMRCCGTRSTKRPTTTSVLAVDLPGAEAKMSVIWNRPPTRGSKTWISIIAPSGGSHCATASDATKAA